MIICSHWSLGGVGAVDLAESVVNVCNSENNFRYWALARASCRTVNVVLVHLIIFELIFVMNRFLYDLDKSLVNKIETIASEMYGCVGVAIPTEIEDKLRKYEEKVSRVIVKLRFSK